MKKKLNEIELTKLTQLELQVVKGGGTGGGSRLNEGDSVSFGVAITNPSPTPNQKTEISGGSRLNEGDSVSF